MAPIKPSKEMKGRMAFVAVLQVENGFFHEFVDELKDGR